MAVPVVEAAQRVVAPVAEAAQRVAVPAEAVAQRVAVPVAAVAQSHRITMVSQVQHQDGSRMHMAGGIRMLTVHIQEMLGVKSAVHGICLMHQVI